jgi:hypothetical protein
MATSQPSGGIDSTAELATEEHEAVTVQDASGMQPHTHTHNRTREQAAFTSAHPDVVDGRHWE